MSMTAAFSSRRTMFPGVAADRATPVLNIRPKSDTNSLPPPTRPRYAAPLSGLARL